MSKLLVNFCQFLSCRRGESTEALVGLRKEDLPKLEYTRFYHKEEIINDAKPNRHFVANIADVLPIRNFI